MRAEVRRLSPADVPGYERFMRTSEAIFKVGFEQLAHVPFSSFMDMVKTVPDLVRLQSYRTVYDLVAQHVEDPRLRMAFSFHPLLIGGNPFRAPSIYCLIAYLERRWGVHFAMGGTGRLVQGLVGLVGSLHGEVRCDAEVASIDSSDGVATGVTLASGERIEADAVVCNADSAWAYRNLMPARRAGIGRTDASTPRVIRWVCSCGTSARAVSIRMCRIT